MADGKKPQKGGKRPEVNTAFEIPEDIYAGYCTPPEEDKNQRKVRIQKIERRWAREWREYRYVTPKYMKNFALNPPCPRSPTTRKRLTSGAPVLPTNGALLVRH